VDEDGKQYYLDAHVAYRRACLNAIEYLKKFGYTGEQAYPPSWGPAPVEGHISGIVDIPNACATVFLPTEIFDFDITRRRRGRRNTSKAGPIFCLRNNSEPGHAMPLYEYHCDDCGPFTRLRP